MSPEHAADLIRLRLTKPESYAFFEWAEHWNTTKRRQLVPEGQLSSKDQISTLVSCGWHQTPDLEEELLVLCFAAWVHADGDYTE